MEWEVVGKKVKEKETVPKTEVGDGRFVMRTESKIFCDQKQLGKVSTGVPCLLRYIDTRRETFVISCSGNSFNTYAGQQLKLMSQGGAAFDEITCMAVDTYHVYTAIGTMIFAWRRGTEVTHKYEHHFYNVTHLLAFGPYILSIDEGGAFHACDIKSGEIKFSTQLDKTKFNASVLMHPFGFTNKVLVGSEEGLLQLWNVEKKQEVMLSDQFAGKKIRAIVQAPAAGVVGVALGREVALYNVQFDVTLFVFRTDSVPISLAFRSDDVPVVMVGFEDGSISGWDLEKRLIMFQEKNAHQDAVTGLEVFMKEPIMISSSPDNSLKAWIFDLPNGGFRLLNSRDGHRKPPNFVKFHGAKELNVLTTGQDSCIRSYHIYNETSNRVISNFKDSAGQDGLQICKFENVQAVGQSGLEDIAAFSSANSEVYTFSFENAKRGSNLKTEAHSTLEVSCVRLTNCNQFVIVGYKTGELHLYNMQSKIRRKCYCDSRGCIFDKLAHKKEITGIAVDVNNSVIASSSMDQHINFWHFKTADLKGTVATGYSILKMFCQRTSNLFGVVLSNFQLWVYDLSSLELVRKLLGCTHPITDAAFSPKCNWITAGTEDGLVRTWDTATSNLLDVFRIDSEMVTCLEYSANGQYLATTISNDLGIILWFNKTTYQHVSLMPLPLDFIPSRVADALSSDLVSLRVPQTSAPKDITCLTKFEVDMRHGLTCLSDVPSSRWRNLLNLSDIKERNKPQQTPKSIPAPFLLNFDKENENETDAPLKSCNPDFAALVDTLVKSKIGKQPVDLPFGWLSCQLKEGHEERFLSDECLMSSMEKMGPSQIDVEIRGLGVGFGGSNDILRSFIELIERVLKSYGRFDTVLAYYGLFLKVHHDAIQRDASLAYSVRKISAILEPRDTRVVRNLSKISAATLFFQSDMF